MVDKPTRENNILDLVFTNNPQMFGKCITVSIKPMSDHKLISFELQPNQLRVNSAISHCPEQETGLCSFNYKMANTENLRKAINDINWDVTLGEEINKFSENLVNAISHAAKEAKVPYHKTSLKTKKKNKKLEDLKEKRKNIVDIIQHNNIRSLHKHEKQIELTNINLEIHETITDYNRKLEQKAIGNIKTNPKSFYSYANKNKHTKTKIGYQDNHTIVDPKRWLTY